MIRLVLSDIDDTLIAYGRPHITPKALNAVHALKDSGVYFSVASGRMPWDLGWLFAGDTSVANTCVCCNGQLVVLDGRIIVQKELDHDALEEVARVLEGQPASLVLAEEGRRLVVGPLAAENPSAKVGKGSFWKAPLQVDEVPDRPFLKSNIPIAGLENVERIQNLLREKVPQLNFVRPNPTAALIDILPPDWSKEKGVDTLRQALGYSMDEVAVFGDGENDLSLIRWAENSVAVANAVPAVQEAARFHIGPARDDAVADALLDIARSTPAGEMPEFMREQERAAHE